MPMRVRFPLFLKKRGGRRTGSRALARAGEALYQSMFVVVGLVGAWWLVTDVIVPDWRLASKFGRYERAECTVLDTRVVTRPGLAQAEFCPELLIGFETNDGAESRVWTRHGVGRDVPSQREARGVLDQFEVGEERSCWYDPQDPSQATLSTGRRYLPWLVLSIPISLVVAGVVGLTKSFADTQTSLERRSDKMLASGGLKWLGDAASRESLASALPDADRVNDSPGVRLAYRLPMDGAESWRVFGMATLCVMWNLLAGVLAYQLAAAGSWSIGLRLALVLLVVATLAAMGAWLVHTLWRDARSVGGAGVTQAELSQHPLRPGDRCRGVLFQSGYLRVRSLTVSLVCEEIATYRQGTDARTATVETRRELLHQARFVKSALGKPYECEFEVALPPDAPHSFVSPHNEVRWSLEVAVGSPGWPNILRRYRLCVYPRSWSEPGDVALKNGEEKAFGGTPAIADAGAAT